MGNRLYILDEPESALSIESQFTLLVMIKNLEDRKSVHSSILMTYPNTEIYCVTDTGLQQINYEDTQQYKLMRYFINNPQ